MKSIINLKLEWRLMVFPPFTGYSRSYSLERIPDYIHENNFLSKKSKNIYKDKEIPESRLSFVKFYPQN
jgi:hypothetical protein